MAATMVDIIGDTMVDIMGATMVDTIGDTMGATMVDIGDSWVKELKAINIRCFFERLIGI